MQTKNCDEQQRLNVHFYRSVGTSTTMSSADFLRRIRLLWFYVTQYDIPHFTSRYYFKSGTFVHLSMRHVTSAYVCASMSVELDRICCEEVYFAYEQYIDQI